MSFECVLQFAGLRIPETDGVVSPSAATCEGFSIRAERYAMDPTRMSLECFLQFAGLRIPETDGPVIAATCEGFSIRAERYA